MKLPEAFVEQTKLLLGDEALLLLAALDETAPVSIRLNPAKTDGFMEMPIIERVSGSIPWSSHGLYLKERPSFTFDPLLHAGCYYVQEASSMFVEQAILKAVDCLGAVDVPIRMLDLCAAPGGKSTLALSVLPEGSLLVANEVIRARANILAENLIKWGNPNVVVTQSDSSAFSVLEDFFALRCTTGHFQATIQIQIPGLF